MSDVMSYMRARPADIRDAYNYFCELHGTEKPMRSRDELHDKIHEAGLFFDARSTPEQWAEFFEELFESGWPLGEGK